MPNPLPSGRYNADSPPPHLVSVIRKRLAKVCADWPVELFEAMTSRAAWIEFKYERALTEGFRSATLREERRSRTG